MNYINHSCWNDPLAEKIFSAYESSLSDAMNVLDSVHNLEEWINQLREFDTTYISQSNDITGYRPRKSKYGF